MGYQESLIVCSTKKGFDRLCGKLNDSKETLDVFVSVLAIGRVKAKLTLSVPFESYSTFGTVAKGSYFVWLAGDRHPFQSGRGLTDDMKKVFDPCTESWRSIFCEYIEELKEMLEGIDGEKAEGACQENGLVRILGIPYGERIKDEYIEQLG